MVTVKRRAEMSASELAIFAIVRQIDPVKLATLKGERAANPRVNRVIYWIEQARLAGVSPGECVQAASAAYADTPERRRLVTEAILRDYRIARHYGCLTPENLPALRGGKSAVATRTKFAGQKLEIDHIVPVHYAPEIARDFANLVPLPFPLNRSKGKRFTARELARAAELERSGLLAPGCTAALAASLDGDGTSSSGISYLFPAAGGFSDPRVIVPRVTALTEQMEDWERRSSAAFDESAYVGLHAAEMTERAALLLAVVGAQAEDDSALVERLAAEVERWHERCRAALARAEEARETAEELAALSSGAVRHWTRELAAARQWLETARAEERAAREELRRAESALSSAESDLRSAESELIRARSAREYAGRNSRGESIYRPVDTAPYEHAVTESRRKVRRYERWVSDTEDALAAAVEERERAERRVAACQGALGYAQSADAESACGLEAATAALACAERAGEEHERSRKLAQAAGERAAAETAETAATRRLRGCVHAAQRDQEAARAAAALADAAHGEARTRSMRGRLEIGWRMEQLRAFDAPMAGF